MNRIESLIFNELASHRAVALPRVGTLRVVRKHAHAGQGEIKAPENKIVYSLETDGDINTVTQLGIEEHEYNRWLEIAMQNDELTIEGVGTLILGEFTPSPELEKTLNPDEKTTAHKEHNHAATQHHDTPKRNVHSVAAASAHHAINHREPEQPVHARNHLTNILLIIAIVLLLALLGLYLWSKFYSDGEKTDLVTRVQVEQPVTQQVKPVLATPVTVEPKYHLIVGSFENPENADKMAARYRRNYPALNIETIENGAGRTLVSVFSSSSEHEVYNKFYNKIAEQTGNWEMWVYRVPAEDKY